MRNAEARSPRVTEREAQVLDLAARGQTDKQIAAQLGISRDTVASYWRRLLSKFGAVSRTEVVAQVAERMVLQRLEAETAADDRLRAEVTQRTRSEARELAQRNLLAAISETSLEYISGRHGFRDVFERFLSATLELTESEYGFMGEVLYDEAGDPYLKTHALTDLSWDDATRQLYDEHLRHGLEFRNLDSLFGHVMTGGAPVIANDAPRDPRRTGVPHGHPPLDAFLGIPVFAGEEMVGMIGLANRPGGYDEEIVEYLRPMVATCATYLMAWRNEQRRREMVREVARSESLVAALVGRMETALLYETLDRRLEFANEAFCRMFQIPVPPVELVGMDCREAAQASRSFFAHPDEFLARVDEILGAGESVYGETVAMADGRTVERDFMVVRTGDAPVGFLWLYRDVTARRRTDALPDGVSDRRRPVGQVG